MLVDLTRLGMLEHRLNNLQWTGTRQGSVLESLIVDACLPKIGQH